jgi:hypothetical protein
MTDEEAKAVHDSFAWAFFAKHLKYTTKLVYDSPACSSVMNDPPNLEPKLQKLDAENKRVLELFRDRENQGLLPPVILQSDSRQGFFVIAATDLPELTLLAEYLGQVRTDKQTANDPNDSIMELLCCKFPNSDLPNPARSLVVIPKDHSNVGRFFNGINNSEKDSKRLKQNVRTMRCQVDGKATVIMYTKRAVKKGEPLVFDYNEAGKNWYPTQDFI